MKFISLFLLLFIISFNTFAQEHKDLINTSLDQWHKAASDADFESYFGLMTDNAVFIGTDATENWDIEAFKAFSKPYFDKGKAWSFTAINRTIYLDPFNKTTA